MSVAAFPLYVEAVRRTLTAEWNPIAAREIPAANPAYDAQAPHLARLLLATAPREKIVGHLLAMETRHMGINRDRLATEQVADRLIQIARRLSSPLPERP